MGAFVVNFHVRTTSRKQVEEVLRSLKLEAAWLAGPSGPWISFWEADASHQDPARMQQIAEPLSRQLEVPVIALMNHDSDFVCYWLYDNGQLLDEYNSCPGYFDGDPSLEESLQADCATLQRYCRPGTSIEQLEEVLKVWTQAEALQGIMQPYIFAEERLAALAPLLEIDPVRINVDYGDIGPEVEPDEIGAEWIGTGEPSDNPGIFGDMMLGEEMEMEGPVTLPASPLHQAAMRGDIDTIERLVAEGANIDETNQVHAVTPLAFAARESTPEVIRRMVQLGATVQPEGDRPVFSSPLSMAVLGGKTDNVRTLVQLGADIHARESTGDSVLHYAAMQGALEMVRLLLELGADPEQTDAAGQTALAVIRVHRQRIEEGMSIVPMDAMPTQLREHIDAINAIEKLLSEEES